MDGIRNCLIEVLVGGMPATSTGEAGMESPPTSLKESLYFLI